MLLWSKSGKRIVWMVTLLSVGIVYGLPIAAIALASISGQWNEILPSHLTFKHYAAMLGSEFATQLRISALTGAIASCTALFCGTWAALSLRHVTGKRRQILDTLFFLPSTVPSVSIGLGLLVAFSRPPLLLNGTPYIVFVAHFVMVSAFCYGNITAGLLRLQPEYDQMAESLGAGPFYRLTRVTLPLLAPYLISAFSLSFALSMGELGATIMIYPPGWVTLPVGIFSLSDRGATFDAATLTMILGVTTLFVLVILSRVSNKAMART